MNTPPQQESRLSAVKDQIRSGVNTRERERRGQFYARIEDLHENPDNERKTFRNMEGLTESIRAYGVIEPLTVEPRDDGTYSILTGHRRYRAAKEAGYKKIEVLIRDPDEAQERRRKSIVSNVQREEVGAVELAEALRTLLDEDEQIQSQDQLARLVGKSKAWVSQMLGILRLSPDLQKKLRNSQKRIPYDAVTTISRVRQQEQQKNLVDDLVRGAKIEDIRQAARESTGQHGTPKDSLGPKPKEKFSTNQETSVIVQSQTTSLLPEQVVASLEQALAKAKANLDNKLSAEETEAKGYSNDDSTHSDQNRQAA